MATTKKSTAVKTKRTTKTTKAKKATKKTKATNKAVARKEDHRVHKLVEVVIEPKPKMPKFEPDQREFPTISYYGDLENQISKEELRGLTFNKRLALWRKLNRGSDENKFIPLLKKEERKGNNRIPLKEAIQQDMVPDKKPNKVALYCPYCASWMPFRKFAYTGYNLCTGCAISSEDFYVKVDNKLFSNGRK